MIRSRGQGKHGTAHEPMQLSCALCPWINAFTFFANKTNYSPTSRGSSKPADKVYHPSHELHVRHPLVQRVGFLFLFTRRPLSWPPVHGTSHGPPSQPPHQACWWPSQLPVPGSCPSQNRSAIAFGVHNAKETFLKCPPGVVQGVLLSSAEDLRWHLS